MSEQRDSDYDEEEQDDDQQQQQQQQQQQHYDDYKKLKSEVRGTAAGGVDSSNSKSPKSKIIVSPPNKITNSKGGYR